MNPYAYMNAVLDEAPTVVKLVLTDASYAIATGPVPAGQVDLKTRVALEVGIEDDVERGFDAAGALVIQFRC